jgi:hypothetical protein
MSQLEVTNHNFQSDMLRSEVPVDVLLNILDHVDKAGLATICLLNKICCSCSQDVLYRDICIQNPRESRVQQTLAQSTHLARKVRSFEFRPTHFARKVRSFESPDLATALRNMASLRILKLSIPFHMDILDGCTFKLDSFECPDLNHYGKSLPKFLSSQPSLKYMTLPRHSASLDATCLPNLTRINARSEWLPYLIPGRPLNEVIVAGCSSYGNSIDFSIFALSTTPIQKFTIDYSCLNPIPGRLFASFLPSLTHITLSFQYYCHSLEMAEVCGLPLC